VSVVSCEELWNGRRAKDGIERIREYTRRYEVVTNNAADDGTVAGGPESAALGLPRNGDPFPSDPDAVLTSIEPTCSDESPYIWYVDCQYSSKIPPDLGAESQEIDDDGNSVATQTAPGEGQLPAPAQRDPNPINWTATYKVTHEQTQEPLTHDYLGNAIVNSAGDPFYPPLMIEKSYAVFTVTKNYGTVNFDYLETYVDTVNLNVWKGRAERTCRMIAFEYEAVQANGYTYWRVVFRIKYKPGSWVGDRPGGLVGNNDIGQGWDMRILDQGFRTRAVSDPGPPAVYEWTDITDTRTGEKPEKPVLLNGTGGKHNSLLGVTSDEPRYVTWEIYKRRDWAGLGL